MRIPNQAPSIIRDNFGQKLNNGIVPSQFLGEFRIPGKVAIGRIGRCIPGCLCVSPINCPCCATPFDIKGTGPTVGEMFANSHFRLR